MNHTKWLRELCEKRIQHRTREKLFAEDFVYFEDSLTPGLAEILLEALDYADTHPRRFPIDTAPDDTPVLLWREGVQQPTVAVRVSLHHVSLMVWEELSTRHMLPYTPTHWAPIPGEDE